MGSVGRSCRLPWAKKDDIAKFWKGLAARPNDTEQRAFVVTQLSITDTLAHEDGLEFWCTQRLLQDIKSLDFAPSAHTTYATCHLGITPAALAPASVDDMPNGTKPKLKPSVSPART